MNAPVKYTKFDITKFSIFKKVSGLQVEPVARTVPDIYGARSYITYRITKAYFLGIRVYLGCTQIDG